nr:FIG00986851 hypothetical protein CDS [Bradyrhizobium sp.]
MRAIWAALLRFGWRGGRVLEPGIGTGLFPALMPEALRHVSHVTGVELDPVTARIARLLQPQARIVTGDFARIDLPARFDLAIGNPPFSDRTVRSDRALRSLGLRLHDYFIVKAIKLLKPGGLAAFVTSHGTMDKANGSARALIAKHADLLSAIRLPEGSFRADAGTNVVVDILPAAQVRRARRRHIMARPGGGAPGDRRRGRHPRQPLFCTPSPSCARRARADLRPVRRDLHLSTQGRRGARGCARRRDHPPSGRNL